MADKIITLHIYIVSVLYNLLATLFRSTFFGLELYVLKDVHSSHSVWNSSERLFWGLFVANQSVFLGASIPFTLVTLL